MKTRTDRKRNEQNQSSRGRLGRAGRVVLAAGVGLLAFSPAAAAGASDQPGRLRWEPNGKKGVGDARLSGMERLRADVSAEGPVDGWAIGVVTPEGEPVFGTVCDERFKRPKDEFRVKCEWDTTRYPDRRPSANGRYAIRLMTWQGDALHPAGPDRAVAVINPAAAPTGVTLSFPEPDGLASLTWEPNPEPDIARYDVEAKIDGVWTRVAETAETRFETGQADSGQAFRVAAERRDADGAADGPGPWTAAARPRRSGPQDRKKTADQRPASRSAADQPESPPGRQASSGAGRDGKPSATGPAEDKRRPAPTAPTGPTQPRPAQPRPDQSQSPPPADTAGLTFAPSSAAAFTALAEAKASGPPAGATAAPASRPAARPAPRAEEPDPGFQATLPYPQAATTQSGEAEAGEAQAGEAQAAPPDPTPADGPPGAVATAGSGTGLRRVGGGLFAAGAALLGLALRPARRTRRRRPRRDEPEWLGRLETCVTRLEACLDQRHTP